jgi:hypothetical protein
MSCIVHAGRVSGDVTPNEYTGRIIQCNVLNRLAHLRLHSNLEFKQLVRALLHDLLLDDEDEDMRSSQR